MYKNKYSERLWYNTFHIVQYVVDFPKNVKEEMKFNLCLIRS